VVDAGPNPSLTLDGQRDFQLDVLNGHEPTDAELQAHYTDTFLAAISPDTFRSTRQTLIQHAPWRVMQEIERRDDTVLAVQLQAADGTQTRLTMHRTPEGKLDASTILMAQPCAASVDRDTRLDPALQPQLDWAMAVIGSKGDPPDAELQQHLAPTFLEAVPLPKFREALGQLRALGPFTLRSYEGQPESRELIARVGLRTGEEARLSLSIEPGQPHRITGFLVLTQLPCRLGS
jgi:hypothetical protein